MGANQERTARVKWIALLCSSIALGPMLWAVDGARVHAQQPASPREGTPPTTRPASAAQPAAAPRPNRPAWPVRLKDGQPDVQGIWDPTQGRGGGSVCAGTTIEPVPGAGGKIPPGCIVDPPDGVIPYHPWARARRDEVKTHYLAPTAAQVDTRTRGWPDGLPRQNYYMPFQILQSPGAVVILYEAQHEFRYIPLDGRPHGDPGIKSWLGSSRGRWEGTTLVVDVRNISDRVRMSSVGDFASDELTITEGWTFVDANTLELSVTMEDPKVFTRTWTLVKKIAREKHPSFELMEYSAVEGDRDSSLMVEIAKKVKEKGK